MRKFILCILVILCAGSFAACGSSSRMAAPEDVAFLTETGTWYHYNEVTCENEKMTFNEDFSFYWGCECGEPVGDSDLYELYDYDAENSEIILYNGYDDSSMKLQVIEYNDFHLMVRIDGKVTDFTKEPVNQ